MLGRCVGAAEPEMEGEGATVPEGARVVLEGARVVLDGAGVVLDGAGVVLDGAGVVMEGAPVGAPLDGAEVTVSHVIVSRFNADWRE